MILVIAEKPSAARAIAKAVAGNAMNRDGFIAGPEITVTWCFGHLLEQAPPERYDAKLKRWDDATLPITISPNQWIMLPRRDAVAQIAIIARLLRAADHVVVAGDDGREGQLLVDELLHYHQWAGPTSRLSTANLTPEALRKAWNARRDNLLFRPLSQSALCRQRADWLVGMNLSRITSIKTGLTTSIGRVQTPTLALIVRRDRLIDGHSSTAFYTLHARAATGRSEGVFTHDTESDRIFDKQEADRIAKALNGQFVDVSMRASVKTEHAPNPFMLATFQRMAEKLHGWGAKRSLDILQSIYDGGWVSYPRVDCEYLPSDQAPDAIPIARAAIASMQNPGAPYLAMINHMAPSKRIYDDAKIGEHHAIIPTNKPMPKAPPGTTKPSTWEAMRQAWQIVAERFLLSLLPSATYDELTASFPFEKRLFIAKGETLREGANWRLLSPREITPLAFAVEPGTTAKARVNDVRVEQGKTTPPKHYTETSLIADMRQAAKFVADPALKATLKDTSGIGTSASQSDIIETLKGRGYAVLSGRGKVKHIISTPFGKYIVDNIPAALCDAGVTAAWEQQLDEIAKGKAQADAFMTRIDRFISRQLDAIRATTFPAVDKTEMQQAVAKITDKHRTILHRKSDTGHKKATKRASKAPRR